MKRLCVGLEVGECSDNRLYCLIFCQYFKARTLYRQSVDGTKIAGRVDYEACNLVALFHRREITVVVVYGQTARSILHVDIFCIDRRYDGFTGVLVVGVVVGRFRFQCGNVGNVGCQCQCPVHGYFSKFLAVVVECESFHIGILFRRLQRDGEVVAGFGFCLGFRYGSG